MIGATIKSLLAADAALTALVSTRIYPYVMNEDTTLPAVVYTIDSLDPVYTKGSWVNDEIGFSIHSFSRNFTQLQSVVSAVRGALERKSTGAGTHDINRIYLSAMVEGYDNTADVYFNRLTFRVTINTY